MSRLQQALKRRDKDGTRGEPAKTGDLLGWRRWHDVETPTVPAWQLERFPVETQRHREAAAEETREEAVAAAAVEPPPIAGRIGPFNRVITGKVVGDRQMNRGAVEQYRRLAASLHHVQMERAIRKVMVSSAVSGEGKTLTALNLAMTLSTSYRRRVVLVDANLRNPSIHTFLDIDNLAGLSEALEDPRRGRVPRFELSPRLSVVPAGSPDIDPIGPLTSPRMAAIIDEVAAEFDWVIVDAPPVAELPDTNLLVGMLDAAVLVIEAGRTPCDLVERAVQAIGRHRILGFVLNNAEAAR